MTPMAVRLEAVIDAPRLMDRDTRRVR